MWIIPKNLQQLSGVPDTEGYSLDYEELSRICEPLLTARSKPSRWQAWLRRWKRESWMQHLYGRILKPSQAQIFTKKWTCLWPDTHASHSAAQGSAEEQTTHATSGRTFETQLDLCSQDIVSLKTSKDTYRLDSPQLSATWKQMVTQQRGEYSARRRSALHTAESGCSSWPTTTTRDYKGCGNAVDRKDGKSRLDTLEAVVKFGQRDLENNSTNGSRRESWPTVSSAGVTGGATGLAGGSGNRKKLAKLLPEKEAKEMGCGKLNPRWVSCLMNVPVMWMEP